MTGDTPQATRGQGPGQPRPQEGPWERASVRSPTAAERARTLVEGSASAALDIPGAEHLEPGGAVPAARLVLPDGDVLLLMAGDSPAARLATHAQDDDLAAVLEITDVAPVCVPHRIRGRAWVTGWLTAVPAEDRAGCATLLAQRHPVAGVLGLSEPVEQEGRTDRWPTRPPWLLRLEVGEVLVDDLWGAEEVTAEEFAAASGDPLEGYEAELLQHLAAAHSDQLQELCSPLAERHPLCQAVAPQGEYQVVPLALDRFGLRVRFTSGGKVLDARFDFPEPVTGHDDLRRAMHILFRTV